MHDAHWENTTLQGIASQICSKNNVKLNYTAPQNPTYATKDQVQESDIAFLSGLCKSEGLILKSTNGTMTIADEKQMDAQAPVTTFTYGVGITNGRLKLSAADTYASAQVTSMNPTSGTKVEGNFDEDDGDPDPDSAYDEDNPQKTTLYVNEFPNYASSDTPQDDLNA
jgi:phage protein D